MISQASESIVSFVRSKPSTSGEDVIAHSPKWIIDSEWLRTGALAAAWFGGTVLPTWQRQSQS